MFPITLHVQPLYYYGYRFSNFNVILLSYLPSDLQRSPTYYYRYIALLSFRGSGGGPIHARVPIHAHPSIYPKQSQLNNKLQM